MILPKPVSYKELPGSFRLNPDAGVFLAVGRPTDQLKWIAGSLAEHLDLNGPTSVELDHADPDQAPVGSIVLAIHEHDRVLGDEGYRLTVKPDLVTLSAATASGLHYAAESLMQLAPRHDAHGRERRIGCVQIEDKPRFAWRGFMLDSARHFQSVDLVKTWIDRIASLKLNVFHWHLTDDQAWRIQIDKYPRLTEVAAWRGNGRHREGGFYSKDEAREVIAYARDRGITVIPEIEMPGHCNAALHAYPELSCSGRTLRVGESGWDAYTQVEGRLAFCVGRDRTLAFIQDVLDEVAEVFDSPYLHVGGDERPADIWSACPHCQQRMQQHGLSNEDELHVWFMSHVGQYVKEKLGRQSICWAEKLDVGIPEHQIIQAWHPGQAASAMHAGRQSINSIHEWTYLDYPWSDQAMQGKPDWMIILPIEKVYDFEPSAEHNGPQSAARLLGSESPVWTEYIETPEMLDSHVMPRLAAFSEVMWTPPTQRDYSDFTHRLSRYLGEPGPVHSPVIYGRMASRTASGAGRLQ